MVSTRLRICDDARLTRCGCGRMTNKRCFAEYGACYLCRKADLHRGKYKIKRCVTCGVAMYAYEFKDSGGYCRVCVTRVLTAKEKAASIAEHLAWLEQQPQSKPRRLWLEALANVKSPDGNHRNCDVAPTAVVEVGTHSEMTERSEGAGHFCEPFAVDTLARSTPSGDRSRFRLIKGAA